VTHGFPIDRCGKSVLAGYLRFWGPALAVIGVATLTIPGIALALLAAAACAWAWTWHSLRGDHAHRRSDFQFLAYGTRCDPRHFPRDMRARMKVDLDRRWTALATARPPEDVARFGAKTLDEAVTAYGLLRLTALDGHAEADAAADKILHDTRDMPADTAGPYRSGETVVDDVLARVTAAASVARPAPVAPARVSIATPPAPPKPWWIYTRDKALIIGGLAVAAVVCLARELPALFGDGTSSFDSPLQSIAVSIGSVIYLVAAASLAIFWVRRRNQS
jgi:hypothetical protein